MKFSPKVLEGFVRRIYGRKFDVKHDIDAQAWREVLRIMNEATVEGIMQSKEPPTLDMDFYKALRHSNEVFSAFKVHKMGNEMAAKLTGSDGKLKSFTDWRRDIESIASHQVGAWLHTEYNTAVVRAHAAADWQQYLRDKDVMPNLRWMPTTSSTPELTHRKFWNAKVNLPVDHPFWTKHYPGDHWNCKCTLEQNDDPVVRTNTGMDDVPQRGLEGNPGITKEIFSDNHPYFPKSCKECGFYKPGVKNRLKGFFGSDKKEPCLECPFAANCINEAGEKLRKDYKADSVFGERLLISKDADQTEVEANTIAARKLLKSFPDMQMTIRPHIISADGIKNPEYTINGLIADRKGIHSEAGIANGFKKAKVQGCQCVVIDTDFAMKNVYMRELITNLYWRKQDFDKNIIVNCYVIHNGMAVKLDKRDFENGKEAIKEKLKRLKP